MSAGSRKPDSMPGGRELLTQWTQQQVDEGKRVELVPDAAAPVGKQAASSPKAPASRSAAATPSSRSASGTSAPSAPSRTTSRRPSTAKALGPAAHVAPAHEASLFDEGPRVQADPDDSMQRIAEEVNACTKCRLHETRDKAVPGVGPDDANLVFIGEGPGADEDRQGEPFVGRAGQLLTKILAAVQLGRDEVFITNIVKCRPPNNRDPRPDEIEACEPYLKRQLRVLDPKVICTLGRHAAMTLLQTKESMARLRTSERRYEGIRLFPTYHPAALLRNPQWKRPVWEDIQKVRQAYDEPPEKT